MGFALGDGRVRLINLLHNLLPFIIFVDESCFVRFENQREANLPDTVCCVCDFRLILQEKGCN